MQFVIITGISGSGKSLALRIFEDMGFYCVDNMPPALIPQLASLCQGTTGVTVTNGSRVACVTDVRAGAHPAVEHDFNVGAGDQAQGREQ